MISTPVASLRQVNAQRRVRRTSAACVPNNGIDVRPVDWHEVVSGQPAECEPCVWIRDIEQRDERPPHLAAQSPFHDQTLLGERCVSSCSHEHMARSSRAGPRVAPAGVGSHPANSRTYVPLAHPCGYSKISPVSGSTMALLVAPGPNGEALRSPAYRRFRSIPAGSATYRVNLPCAGHDEACPSLQ